MPGGNKYPFASQDTRNNYQIYELKTWTFIPFAVCYFHDDYYILINQNNEIAKEKVLDFIFVKSEGRLEKILLKDILYLEAMQNYTIIYHKNAKTIVLQLIKHFEELLDNNNFIRIHKSHIIAVSKVDAIEGNMVVIGNKKLPFAKQNKEEIFKKLSIWIGYFYYSQEFLK